jgi:hypothetical protein
MSSDPTDGYRFRYQVAQTLDDEAISSQSLAEQSLKNGNQWTFSEVFTLANAETEQIYIENPIDSRIMRVIGLTIDPTERTRGEWSENVTQDTAGTDFDYLNNLATDPTQDEPPFNMHIGGTYSDTGNGYIFESAAGPQQPGGFRRGTTAPRASVARIEPGSNRHLELESLADGNTITVQATISTRPE